MNQGYSGARFGLAASICITAFALMCRIGWADDVSAPTVLQYFEATYKTIESRTPDVFQAGYGSIYTPPPGRADTGNLSVGYDQYDRFDLGKPGNPTLYGTETGLRSAVGGIHQAGLDYYLDLVLNHNGYSGTSSNPADNAAFYNAGGYPGMNISLPYDVDGDFNSAYDYSTINGRLAGLIDINHSKNYQMIRSPVNPNDSRNIRPGTTPWNGRLANVPDPNNRRFYPDQNLQPIYVFDPQTGEQNIAIYPFNPNNTTPLPGQTPTAYGTPMPENVTGYLMRNTQWLVQSIGVDGFRIDAAKHIEGFTLDYFDRSVYRQSRRYLLDGEQKQVFSFSEAFDGNNDYLATFVKKTINPSDPGRIGGNRDVLNFPAYFALHDNLTGNGYTNDWRNVASRDTFDLQTRYDPHLVDANGNTGTWTTQHTGFQGVRFVQSHDSDAPYLSNVAHAYSLMMPGNSIVYYNAGQFGTPQERGYFPKGGRGDALGGTYGSAITDLVQIRNVYAQGNYVQRWLSKESFAFEREGASLTLLSNRLDGQYDNQQLSISLPYGTPLIELTGNARKYGAPQLLEVTNNYFNGPSVVNASFLPNNGGDHGYLVYGLASPQGQLSLGGVAQTLAGSNFAVTGTNHNDAYSNAVTRATDIQVIAGNAFTVTLNTNQVKLLGYRRDHDADGDNALLKLDGGVDLNGNGHVDFVTPGTASYGFETFQGVFSPGYFDGNGNGTYSQAIDTSGLADGMHYLTVRAFRHRADGYQNIPIYTDWKESLYVDRHKPLASFALANSITYSDGSVHTDQRDFIVKSVDQLADHMNVFLDLPSGLSDSEVLNLIGGGNLADVYDRDLFKKYSNNVSKGNHTLTVVTFKIDGNFNIQRFTGINTNDSTLGAAMGDAVGNNGMPDGYIEGNDVLTLYDAIRSNGRLFYAADDFNSDGLMTFADWTAMGNQLHLIHDAGTLNPAGGPLVSQGTIDYYNSLSSTVPEPKAVGLICALGWLLRRRFRRVAISA